MVANAQPTATEHAAFAAASDLPLSRFVVLDVLAQSDAGFVYRAYDSTLRREIVLEGLRATTPDAQASLVAQAQAMATLLHPNLLAVYDVARWSEHIVLTMEYVPGQTLRAWLDGKQPRAKIIAAFVQAGHGLVAAHRIGLVHGQFQPRHVLVSDDERVVVTGFDASLKQTSTSRYTAPEQHRDRPIDAGTDQYAFCVALWEALCGAAPFDDAREDAEALLEAKLRGPPPWPLHAKVPHRIANALRRGLAPVPADRWPTMQALLVALADAKPRGRRALGLGIGAALPCAALAGSLWWTHRVEQTQVCSGAEQQLETVWNAERVAAIDRAVSGTALPYAPATLTHVHSTLESYAQAWSAQHRESCEATAVHGIVPAEVMDLRMACLHRAKLGLASVVDVMAQADAATVENAANVVAKLPSLARCEDIEALRAEIAPPEDPAAADAVLRARSALAAANALDGAAKQDAALEQVEAAEAILEGIDHAPIAAELEIVKGLIVGNRGDVLTAEALISQGMRRALAVGAGDLAVTAALHLVQFVGSSQRRHTEGLRLGTMALDLASQPGRDESMVAGALNMLAPMMLWTHRAREAQDAAERAVEIWQRLLGTEAPRVGIARTNLAAILIAAGRYAEARAELQQGIEILEASLGATHPRVLKPRANLAILFREEGRYAQAVAEQREVVALLEQSLGPNHPDMAMMRDLLGTMLGLEGKLADAEAEHRRAIVIWSQLPGEQHPRTAKSRDGLASVLRRQGRYEEAIAERKRALEQMERQLGAAHWDTGQVRSNLGEDRLAAGDIKGAELEFRHAVAAWEQALGHDHPNVADVLRLLADTLRMQGRDREALVHLERAWSSFPDTMGDPLNRGLTGFALAQLLWPAQHERALEIARSAKRSLELAADREPEVRQRLDAWLAEREPS